GPDVQWPPDETIHRDDHETHRYDRGDLRGNVVSRDCHAHVGAQTRQLEIFVSQSERFVDGEKKPAARHRDHAVVNQSLRRKRQLDLQETLQGPKMAKFAHLAELVRNPLERVIVAEHHIPNLGGKIMSTQASSRPKLLFGNNVTNARTKPGMNPKTGMLWRMSKAGKRTVRAFRS